MSFLEAGQDIVEVSSEDLSQYELNSTKLMKCETVISDWYIYSHTKIQIHVSSLRHLPHLKMLSTGKKINITVIENGCGSRMQTDNKAVF